MSERMTELPKTTQSKSGKARRVTTHRLSIAAADNEAYVSGLIEALRAEGVGQELAFDSDPRLEPGRYLVVPLGEDAE